MARALGEKGREKALALREAKLEKGGLLLQSKEKKEATVWLGKKKETQKRSVNWFL